MRSAAVTHLLGAAGFKAGPFCDETYAELSAVIFTNACTIAKLSRVPNSSGFPSLEFRFAQLGEFFDRAPGARYGIPFSLDVSSTEYRKLWPQYSREPWCAELEVFHNPFARHPIPRQLIPEAQHWFAEAEDISCQAFFETSILKSQTFILSFPIRIISCEPTISATCLDWESNVRSADDPWPTMAFRTQARGFSWPLHLRVLTHRNQGKRI